MSYWTSATKDSANNWIWGITKELVIDDLWLLGGPHSFFCASDMLLEEGYRLSDWPCWFHMCYICESAGDTTEL